MNPHGNAHHGIHDDRIWILLFAALSALILIIVTARPAV
jgi:hypothetical protein